MSMTDEGFRPLAFGGLTSEEFFARADEFTSSDDMLLSPGLMKDYPDQWVAAYKGKIVGTSACLGELMARLRTAEIPLGHTAIRYIEKNGMAAA